MPASISSSALAILDLVSISTSEPQLSVGGTRTLKCDVRIVAATNRDLGERARQGQFRPDLYYWLNVFPIELPPLRQRREDIPALTQHFAAKLSQKIGRTIQAIEPQTMAALQAYAWLGNIRELEHVIEGALILSRAGRLELGDWFAPPVAPACEDEIKTLEA